MPFYPVVPGKTALIVFDMTRGVVERGADLYSPQAKEVITRLAPLVARCRSAGMPVIFVRQVLAADGSDAGLLNSIYPGRTAYRRGDPGIEIHPDLGMQSGDWLIDKNRFSAFWGTGLHDRLLQRGIDTVIITGCSTAVGCETTARDATTRDLKVIFASDGTVTRPLCDLGWGAFSEDEVRRMTLTVLGHTFARIASIQEILKEIP
jgi:ureidoacrylate peracid hydrolase